MARGTRAQDSSDIATRRRHVAHSDDSRGDIAVRQEVALASNRGCVPLHRAIVGIDVVNSTARVNPAKALLRQGMHRVLDDALRESGIEEDNHDALVDCGDGALILIKPSDELPKTALLTTLVPLLEQRLADHNSRHPHHAFQLRVAVHAGEVHFDRWGQYGEALDVTCRLLDAPALKRALADSEAPLALVVSDDLYRSIVRHGYDDIDSDTFSPAVRVEVAGAEHIGWIRDLACGADRLSLAPAPGPVKALRQPG
jgi:hypothetical protein